MALQRISPGWSIPPSSYLGAISRPFQIEICRWQEDRRPCPRCGKVCDWIAKSTIVPESQIRIRTLLMPVCPCPTDQIEQALVRALADALVAELRRQSDG